MGYISFIYNSETQGFCEQMTHLCDWCQVNKTNELWTAHLGKCVIITGENYWIREDYVTSQNAAQCLWCCLIQWNRNRRLNGYHTGQFKKKLQTGGTTIKMEIIFERINEKKF